MKPVLITSTIEGDLNAMSSTASETIIEVPALSTGIAEYDNFTAGVAALRSKYGGIRFDLGTVEGNKDARVARQELVKLRTSVENRRKELKAPALARSRLIDTAAKQITDEIVAIEEPIDAQIKAQEERKEAERLAKAKVEAARVQGLRDRVDGIFQLVRSTAWTSSAIEKSIAHVIAMEIGTDFQELQLEAIEAKTRVLSNLSGMLAEALSEEEEKARFAAEKAEFERQRAEQEKQDREAREAREVELKAEDERRDARRAEEEAKRKTERNAEMARQKAEDDRLREERDEFEAKKKADDHYRAAEYRRIADERAELNRQQAEAKAKADAEADRFAREAREAEAERVASEQAALVMSDAEAGELEDALEAAYDRLRDAAPALLAALTDPILLDVLDRISRSGSKECKGLQAELADWFPIRDAALSLMTEATGS